ncbi:MAG: hypothetical protein JSS66_17610 [Armatimonadetes bacterium]|nr:hypothetical protein [Armatimonadota bacterium]
MTLVLVAFLIQTAVPGAPVGDSPADLLHRPAVQAELALSQQQVQRWSEIDRLPKLRRGGTFEEDPLILVDPDEQEKKDLAREQKAWSILSPGQALRLRELTIQRAGIKALLRQDVQGELELSEDQRLSVLRAKSAYNITVREIIKKGASVRLDQKKVRDLLAKKDQELVDALTVIPTPAQNTKLESMAGRKFKFSG